MCWPCRRERRRRGRGRAVCLLKIDSGRGLNFNRTLILGHELPTTRDFWRCVRNTDQDQSALPTRPSRPPSRPPSSTGATRKLGPRCVCPHRGPKNHPSRRPSSLNLPSVRLRAGVALPERQVGFTGRFLCTSNPAHLMTNHIIVRRDFTLHVFVVSSSS